MNLGDQFLDTTGVRVQYQNVSLVNGTDVIGAFFG